MVRNGTSVHERVDRSCDLLGSAHRRRVIYALRSDGPATVADLADEVVAAGLADDRDQAVASLVHVHLPKLDEFDVIEYENPDERVRLSDGVDRLDPLLAVAARRETDRELANAFDDPIPDAVADSKLD